MKFDDEIHKGSPAIDLSNCDREPIHIPGLIQPHGMLWEIGDGLKILRVSENVEFILGWEIDSILGSEFLEFIETDDWDFDLSEAIRERFDTSRFNPLNVFFIHKDGDKIQCDVTTHKTINGLLIEAELPRKYNHLIGKELNFASLETIQKLREFKSLDSISDYFAQQLRYLTNYDRVMVYRFDKNWNGEVISESKREDLLPFLGLHYPASDIPKQARKLYEKNLIRIIPDINYKPSRIINWDILIKDPLDLSDSILRSVSPMHVEYLQNMGVGATMTISIIIGGNLWGLIACHHYSAKFISNELRASSLLLGQFFSSQIESLIQIHNQNIRIEYQAKKDKLISQVQSRDNIVSGLIDEDMSIMDYVECDGVALIWKDSVYKVGITPTENQIFKLLPLIDEFSGYNDLFYTDSLLNYGNEYMAMKDVACGIISGSVISNSRLTIIWFRREVIHTIKWSGDPHKPITWDGKDIPRLHPRKSFDEWKEIVKYHSIHWEKYEKDAIEDLMSGLGRFFLKKSEIIESLFHEILVVKKSEEEALEKLSEKDLLVREMHHRVKNNLQIIISLLSLQGSFVNDQKVETAIMESQSRIRSMALVHDILYQENNLESVDLHKYINVLANHVAGIYKNSTKNIWVEIDVIPANLNINQLIPLGLILNELLMNSYKYAFVRSSDNEDESDTIEPKRGELIYINIQRANGYSFRYKDSGIGYPDGYPDSNRKSLGTMLIQNLSKQLNGQIRFWNDMGANFSLEFPY